MIGQFDLFPSRHADEGSVGAADQAVRWDAVGRQLPGLLLMGTSDWTFPAWVGQVYDRRHSERELARTGLIGYAGHPLFRCVGIEKSYYEHFSASAFGKLAEQVPEDFRFLVKAHASATAPTSGISLTAASAEPGDRFLDSKWVTERVIEPALEGLGHRLGAVLFQIPSLGVGHTRHPDAFVDRLEQFLSRLPTQCQYGIEVCNREFLTPRYAQVLADTGATHSFCVHPRMPSLLEQADILGSRAWAGAGAVVLRWMLHPRHENEVAQRRYFPYDRLVDPDLSTRLALVELVTRMMADGKTVLVLVDNKAEGSAPLSIAALAEECMRQWRCEDLQGTSG